MNGYQAAFAQLPDTLQSARRIHLQAFLERGFPTRRDEDWKYTDLSALAKETFALAAPLSPRFAPLEGCELLVLANGQLTDGDKALAGSTAPEHTEAAIPALNAAFAQAGVMLEVPANATRTPLDVVTWFGGTGKGMAHLRHRVVLRENASATLVIRETGDDSAFFATQVMEVVLEPGSRFDLVRLQSLGANTISLTRFDVRVGRDATFRSVSFDTGAALARHDLNVAIAEPGASAGLHGVLMPHAREHLDIHTRIDHRSPYGTSREGYRAIVTDRARAVFNGKVIVHPGAQKTDSEQHVDSLLLTPGAEVNAKPELEIYADDVKCAHGATCGQLDDSAIYYLRSRGIAEQDARNVLLYTFADEILKRIPLESARHEAERMLLSRLPQAAALVELA